MGNLFNTMRKALGVSRQRASPPVGPRPRLGARLVKSDLRMTVQAGLKENTWSWLVAQGWREQTFRGDRRAYREIPPSRVAELFDATTPDELRQLLQEASAEAELRPPVVLPQRR